MESPSPPKKTIIRYSFDVLIILWNVLAVVVIFLIAYLVWKPWPVVNRIKTLFDVKNFDVNENDYVRTNFKRGIVTKYTPPDMDEDDLFEKCYLYVPGGAFVKSASMLPNFALKCLNSVIFGIEYPVILQADFRDMMTFILDAVQAYKDELKKFKNIILFSFSAGSFFSSRIVNKLFVNDVAFFKQYVTSFSEDAFQDDFGYLKDSIAAYVSICGFFGADSMTKKVGSFEGGMDEMPGDPPPAITEEEKKERKKSPYGSNALILRFVQSWYLKVPKELSGTPFLPNRIKNKTLIVSSSDDFLQNSSINYSGTNGLSPPALFEGGHAFIYYDYSKNTAWACVKKFVDKCVAEHENDDDEIPKKNKQF